MYGYLNLCLKEFVLVRFNENLWAEIVQQSKCPEDFDELKYYEENVTERLIYAATTVLKFKREQLLEMVGEFYLHYSRSLGHDEFLRNLGTNVLAFLQNIDSTHSYAKCNYVNLNMPSLRCGDDSRSDFIILHYYSYRKNLYHMVVGMVKEIAKVYFKKEATFQLISVNNENVCEKNGYREHVIWNITLKNITEKPKMARPRFVAETEKHSEKVIQKTQLEIIKRKIAEAQFITVTRKQAIKSKWKAVVKFAILSKGGNTGFTYPAETFMNSTIFCNLFPYHFIFDEKMNLRQAGVQLQALINEFKSTGQSILPFFKLVHPSNVDFNWENCLRFIQTPHIFKCERTKLFSWMDKPDLYLRGQIVNLKGFHLMLFIGSPLVRSLNDLETRNMKFSEIPIHDVTRDLILMNFSNTIGFTSYTEVGGIAKPTVDQLLKWSPNTAVGGGISGAGGGQGAGNGGGNRLALADCPYDKLNTEKASKNPIKSLKIGEKDGIHPMVVMYGSNFPGNGFGGNAGAGSKKNNGNNDGSGGDMEKLKYLFLPSGIASLLKSGKTYQAQMHENVCVLFGDICQFNKYASEVGPSVWVKKLNEIYVEYERLANLHKVFRVETVGDAYMLASGIMEPAEGAVEKIADMALAMQMLIKTIDSPLRTNNIKIRVGLHRGSVLCGIVNTGNYVNRLLVMGDTATIASRMESYGLPDKIHVTEQVANALKALTHVKYKLEEREPSIQLRNFGTLNTYFLLANESTTTEKLLGKEAK